MTNQMIIRQNIGLAVKILSAIWLRRPVIFNIQCLENKQKYMQEIISFIPDYRQLIFYGEVPRLLAFNKFRLKILKIEQSDVTRESLYQCFAEESSSTPPLQIVYFEAHENGIKELIKNLERGWLAFVNGESTVYQKLDESGRILFIDFNNVEMPDPERNLISNRYLEYELLERSYDSSGGALLALLQKKMNEIRYIGQALIYEIESGKKLSQAEIQQIFEIDSRNFNKVLEVLKVESGIDIAHYIRFIPEIISVVLEKIQKIAGVNTVACLFKKQLLGINKGAETTFFPLKVFLPFVEFYEYMISTFDEGANKRLNIELTGGRTVLLFKEENLPNYNDLIFILLMDSNSNVILTLKIIKTIFKEL